MKTILYIDRQIETTIQFIEKVSHRFEVVTSTSIESAIKKIKNGFSPETIVCAAYQNKEVFENFFEYLRTDVSEDMGLVAIVGAINPEEKFRYQHQYKAEMCRIIDAPTLQ
jgi:hypothetical protein